MLGRQPSGARAGRWDRATMKSCRVSAERTLFVGEIQMAGVGNQPGTAYVVTLGTEVPSDIVDQGTDPEHPPVSKGKLVNGLEQAVDARCQIHDPALVPGRREALRYPAVNVFN